MEASVIQTTFKSLVSEGMSVCERARKLCVCVALCGGE